MSISSAAPGLDPDGPHGARATGAATERSPTGAEAVTHASPDPDIDSGAVEIDAGVAHEARMYDYLLGGTSNFAADRAAVDRAAAAIGGIDNARANAFANRAFLGRAVRHLAVEAGIRQFLDIGTGIPLAGTADLIARHAMPGTSTVYADNDPIVLAHAHALLRGQSDGAVAYVDGDLRDPGVILARAADTLDLTRPAALVLGAVLQLLGDDDDPHGVVAELVGALAPGSHLVISHLAADIAPDAMAAFALCLDRGARETSVLRDHDEVSRFFAGLRLVAPGVVQVDQWRPRRARPLPLGAWVPAVYGGVGRRP